MKYIIRSFFAVLLVALASFGAEAAVTFSGAPQFSGGDDFGYPFDGASRTLPAAAAWVPSRADKASSAAVVPANLAVPLSNAARAPSRPGDLGVFSSVAISAARLPASAKWSAVSTRSYAELFTDDCGKSGLSGCNTGFASKLRAVSSRVQGMGAEQLLGEVNRSVNGAMRYRTDSRNWGQSDYWANPSEIAKRGAGDCEDFAIAKYWLLRSLGYAPDKLQVVVLSDTRRQLYHAVLVAHVNGTAYVLDNLSGKVSSDASYANYVPIMSFVAGKSYIHGFAGRSSAIAALPSDMTMVSPGEGI